MVLRLNSTSIATVGLLLGMVFLIAGVNEVGIAALASGGWKVWHYIMATVIGCVGCGVRAAPHGRRTVRVRDLPIGGRPVVLAWRKRLWRCREPACGGRTWTERTVVIRPGRC
jgi:transposase